MLQRFLCVLICLFVASGAVRADDFIDQANGFYKTIQAGKRSDLVLLPLVAKMDAPPAPVSTPDKAMLVAAGSSAWSAAEAWANAAPQRAILEALDKITKEENPVQAFAFGQPYGSDALATGPDGIAMVRAGLYTELGDPPLLAAAKFQYLPALDRVGALVNVEATRLASTGKIDQAIDVLIDWVFFARQIADRVMFQECRWGIRTMSATMERIRDVAYVDFRVGKRELTPDQIATILTRIRPDGYIGVDRMTFPLGGQVAAKQVIAATYIENGGPNKENFSRTMARLASTQRPLRLFAEAARWNDAAATQANWKDANDQITRVYGDWVSRWPLEPFDQRQSLKSDYEKTNPARFSVVVTVLPDMSILSNDRQVLRTQLVGTRCSLGVTAFYYRTKDFPPKLESIRPTFVKVIEADPFNPDRARGKMPPLEYFVPVRDQPQGSLEGPKPHEMNVLPRGGDLNFQVKLNNDQFVLYSVGPDGSKDWAKEVTNEPAPHIVGDLLIWPPATSLLRQRLQETGQLK